ncbi:site-specific integrase [Bacillus pacificus]
MQKNVVPFPSNKETTISQIQQFKFGVASHKMVYKDGVLKEFLFIVLKHRDSNTILEVTPYSKYLRYNRNRSLDSRRASTVLKKARYICMFLNYLLIDMYSFFKITDIKDIKIEHGTRFLQAYADGEVGSNERKKNETINLVMIEIAKFYEWIQKIHEKKATHIHGKKMLEKKEVKNKKSEEMVVYKTPFSVVVTEPTSSTTFRDIPNKVFWILLKLSQAIYPQITLAIALQAFAGLRAGEVCNIRQDICPIDGGGVSTRLVGGKLETFRINLKNQYVMRSDGVYVGGIKRRRDQFVYSKFRPIFYHLYKKHIKWLEQQSIDKGYFPLFVNQKGMAMTVQDYREKFKTLVHTHLVQVLSESDDYELRAYAELLDTNQLSTHALRHWFSVQLVLSSESIHKIASWRGDKDLNTALIYLTNKSELLNLHNEVNSEIINDVLNFGL